MLKHIFSLLVLSAVMLVFYNEYFDTPFVNQAELTATREKAVALADEGKYQESITIFEALIEVAPESKEVWGDYLLVLLRANQKDQAYLLSKQKEIELIPAYAFKDLFELAVENNDGDFAELLARAEVKNSKVSAHIAIERAQRLAENGLVVNASSLIDYTQQFLPDGLSDLAVTRLMILSKTDPFQAQQQAKILLTSNDSVSNEVWTLYVNYWVEQARKGNPDKAIAALKPLLDKAPDEVNLKLDYLVMLTWDDQFNHAGTIYDEYLLTQPLPDYVKSAAAQTLYNLRRLDESKELYKQLLASDPANVEYKKGLAKVYVELNQPSEALAILQPSSSLVDHDARIIIGLAQQQLGRDEEALASLSAALNSRKVEDDRTYHVWLQSFQQALKNNPIDELWPRYSFPLETAPADVLAYLNNKISNQKRAKAVKNKPNRSNSRLEYIRLNAATSRQQGNSAKAIKFYKKALAYRPKDKDLQLGLALVLIDSGESKKSMKILANLYQKYPYDRQVLDANVYYAQEFGRADMQAEYLRQLAEISKGVERENYIASWLNVVSSDNNFVGIDTQLVEMSKFSVQNHPQINVAKARLMYTHQRCDRAKRVLRRVDKYSLSKDQLEQLAYISRHCGYSDIAFDLYEEGMLRFPSEAVFFAGAILVATDMENYSQAKSVVDCCEDRFNRDLDFNLARAYLYFNLREYQSALDAYKEVLRVESRNQEAKVGRIMALAELGMAEAAFIQAQSGEIEISNSQWKRLHELKIQQVLMQAVNSEPVFRESFANEAVKSVDHFLEFLNSNLPDDSIARRNALLNKVHAQTLSGLHAEAIATYESLGLSVEDIPVWGNVHAAEAYAGNRQPEKAVQILEYANDKEPDNLNILSALMFASIDMEDYDNAGVAMSRMNKIVEGQEVNDGRTHWVARLDAMFQAYQNRLKEAEKRLLALQANAPSDPDILKNLAIVNRWRGLTNKSSALLGDASQVLGQDMSIGVAKTSLLIDSQQYSKARQNLQKLNAEYSYHKDVKRLQKRWDTHVKRLYTLSTQYGESSGNALGNKDFTIEQRLYTAPIYDQYRVYVRDRYDWAEFPEDNGNLHRVGIGGEYRSDSYDVSAEINASVRDDTDPGVTLNGVWKRDDHVSLFGELQSYSRNVPLRAINADIDGESVSAGAQYRWDESHYLRASASFTDFSDGNQRTSFFIQHEHDVYQSAHHQIYLSEEFYISENTEDDVGYFNPEGDYSFRVAAKYRGVIWREYEKSLTHRLNLGIGNYKQENESNAGIWDIEYRQQWAPSHDFEVDYGVLHRRRSYDGEAESYNAISASVNWRF
ncbi:MAG: poly-beta-1,6 N-acetyl-D-glucosamine export porin PgaA [Gammaproteobacteria bacterium]